MNERDVHAQGFPCDQCGGQLTYDATSGHLRCGHCGAIREVAPSRAPIVEHDFFSGVASAPRGLGTEVRVHRCGECGAHVSFPTGTSATRCTFCGSPHVLDQGDRQSALRPESLVPFAVDKRTANGFFGKWIRGLWFRPADLGRRASVEEVSGVYVPFWTYDADVESQWRAERGTYYEVDEDYTIQEAGEMVRKTRRVRQTSWEPAWGQRRDVYDDVLVCASRGLPPDLANHFRTFDTRQLIPYSPGYLAGWRAEEYAIDLQQGWQEAQRRIAMEQSSRCGRDVGGDTQRALSVDHRFHRVTFKHVLLPVWLAAYRYRGKVYRFLVNGQTGEVVGKAPWSVVKLALFFAAIVAAIVAIYLLTR